MERNVSCSFCGNEQSDRFCICALAPLGPTCWEAHLIKAKDGVHFALPLAARPYVTRNNQKQFAHWLLNLKDSQGKLRANLLAVDSCLADIQTGYEGLIQDLTSAKDQVLSQVRAFRAALAVGIDQAIQETTDNAYRSDYQPSSYLAQQVWAHCSSGSSEELQVFHYEVKCTDERLRDPLEVSIQTAPELAFSHLSGGASLAQQLQDSTYELQRLTDEATHLRTQVAVLTDEIASWKVHCQGLEAQLTNFSVLSQEATRLRQELATEKAARLQEVAQLRSQAVVLERTAKREEELVHVANNAIRFFDFQGNRWKPEVRLRHPIQVNSKSRWVLLEEGILCCGGDGPTAGAYILGRDGAVDTLPNMCIARYQHGVLAVSSVVYVLGGVCKPHTGDNYHEVKACEKLFLDRRTWRPIEDMREARYSFNPCLFNQAIYVCGAEISLIEALLLPTEQFIQPCGTELPETKSPVCMCVDNNLLVIHTDSYALKFAAGPDSQLILRSQEGLHSKFYKDQQSQPVIDSARRLVYIVSEEGIECFHMDSGAVGEEIGLR